MTKDKDGKCCGISAMCKDMSADRKLQTIYGVMVLVFGGLSHGYGWAFWLLMITGVSMIADAMFNMCFFAKWVRKTCGGSCDDKGACDSAKGACDSKKDESDDAPA